MILKDETASRKRGMPYMYIMFPYSHNPVFPQLVIQGSPADAEYTSGKSAVVAGLPKYPKYLLLLLFRTDNHVYQFHALIQIQFLCGYPANTTARRTVFFSSRIFPGQPYCRNMAAASRSKP